MLLLLSFINYTSNPKFTHLNKFMVTSQEVSGIHEAFNNVKNWLNENVQSSKKDPVLYYLIILFEYLTINLVIFYLSINRNRGFNFSKLK